MDVGKRITAIEMKEQEEGKTKRLLVELSLHIQYVQKEINSVTKENAKLADELIKLKSKLNKMEIEAKILKERESALKESVENHVGRLVAAEYELEQLRKVSLDKIDSFIAASGVGDAGDATNTGTEKMTQDVSSRTFEDKEGIMCGKRKYLEKRAQLEAAQKYQEYQTGKIEQLRRVVAVLMNGDEVTDFVNNDLPM